MTEPAVLLQGEDGRLYASRSVLERWRLRIPQVEPLLYEGQEYFPLNTGSGVTVDYSPEEQRVSIDVPADRFQLQRSDLERQDLSPMTPPGTGAFLNYDLFAQHFGGRSAYGGVFEAGFFTPLGVGLTTFIGDATSDRQRLVRLETSWTIDRPDRLTTIRLGDGISGGGVGAYPVRYGGIHYGRNFATRPTYVTMPLLTLEGSAAVPSVVDVYVNNVLQGSQSLAAGPFEIGNVPVPSGGGRVQLVMRDMLGRIVVAEQNYYASAGMLRRGLHDFSYDLGFLRERFGIRNADYGSFFAATSHRYGLSDKLTVEAHAEAGESAGIAGAGLLLSMGPIGLLGGSAAISVSERGTGMHFAASYERRADLFSLGLRGEYASAAYSTVGTPEDFSRPRFDIHAFADVPVAGGVLGANIVHRDHRDRTDESFAGIFASRSIARSASLQLFARRSIAGRAETTVGGHIAFSFGNSRSLTASSDIRRGRLNGHTAYNYNPPSDLGTSYSLAASLGERPGADARLVHHGRSATYGGEVSYFDGQAGIRLSAAGSLGLVGGDLFAARRLGASFAVVRVPDFENVRVYADNRLVGRTGREGTVIVPQMRAFDRNTIRIEEGDLPIDVRLSEAEMTVRPFAYAGSVIEFDARQERGLLLELVQEDGSPVPVGATVEFEGRSGQYVVVSGGEVYLPAPEGEVQIRARWVGKGCSVTLAVPDDGDPQPRFDNVVCRGEGSHVAR